MRHLGVETNRVIFKTHGPEMFFFPSIFLTTKTEACGVLPSGPWGTFVASRGRLSGADLVWNCKLQILGRDCEGGWGGRVVIVGWLLGIVGLTTKSCWFCRWLGEKPHLVSRISMRNGSHFDHLVGANPPNWWYLKLWWYPWNEGNDTLRVSGRKIPQLFTSSPGRLWDKLLGDCGINMDKLVMKPEVWSINSKDKNSLFFKAFSQKNPPLNSSYRRSRTCCRNATFRQQGTPGNVPRWGILKLRMWVEMVPVRNGCVILTKQNMWGGNHIIWV